MRTLNPALTAPRLATLLLPMICALPAVAAADSVTSPPETTIVITATKTPKPLTRVSSSITVVTSKQLNASHQPMLVDALRQAPGIYVSQSGGPGTNANVFLRGGGSGDTLVMIDSVPVNDPSSPERAYDLSNLTVDNVDRVEILRGAQSTLYGSNATAGVINIITRSGIGKPTTDLTLEGGAYKTATGSLESAGSGKGWGYSASASKYVTTGFPLAALQPNDTENDGYRNATLSTRIDKQLSRAFSLNIIGRYIRAADHYTGYGSLNGTTYIALDDGTHEYNSEETVARAELAYRPATARWNGTAGVETNSLNRDYLDLPDAAYSTIDYTVGPGNYNGRMYKLYTQANYSANAINLFTFGAESEQDRSQYNSIADGLAANARSLTTGSGYAQDQLTFNPAWSATLGARLDDIQQYGHQGTYHVGTLYRLARSGTSYRTNFSTGFKAPTLYDLYDPTYGNSSLKPETSETFDASVDQVLFGGRGSMSVTTFNDRYRELISYNPVTFQTINIGSATAVGAEVDAAYHLVHRFELDVNYTYTRARDNFGNALLRRPGNIYAATLYFQATRKLDIDVTGQFVGNRDDTDGTAAPVVLPEYTLINIAGEYAICPTCKLFARLENVTNADYQEDYSYRTAGRGIYGGVTAQL